MKSDESGAGSASTGSESRQTPPLRVTVFSRESRSWAVARIRLLDALDLLRGQGRVEFEFASRFDPDFDATFARASDLWIVHREFADRELSGGLFDTAESLRIPVVLDLDDLITRVPSHHPMRDYLSRVSDDVIDAVRRSRLVTVSTEILRDALAREVPEAANRLVVLRNAASEARWRAAGRSVSDGDDRLVIGWYGSPTHAEDLGMIRDALVSVLDRHGDRVRLDLFGFLPEFLRGVEGVRLAVPPDPDYARYVERVRSFRVDIGIAPLQEHAFNHAKSDLKWLEYGIQGIPGVFSAVGAYRSVTDGATGIVAKNDTDAWVEAIERLIEDPVLRVRIGQRARKQVRAERAMDAYAERLEQAWRDALESAREGGGVDAGASGAEESAAAWLEVLRARQQIAAGRHEGAADSLIAAVSKDAGVAGAAIVEARRIAGRARKATAIRCLAAVVERVPECAEGHLALSELLVEAGDLVGAERALDRAARHHAADEGLLDLHIRVLRAANGAGRIGARVLLASEADPDPERAVKRTQVLVDLGLLADARRVIERAWCENPDVDFSPLTRALSAAPSGSPRPDGIRVAVYSTDPMSSRRARLRLLDPLRVLQDMGSVAILWSDGDVARDAVRHADCVVLHRAFARRDLAGPVLDAARERGIPVVFETDELPSDAGEPGRVATEDTARVLAAADAVTVPSEALKIALCSILDGVKDKILVVESGVDVTGLIDRTRTRVREAGPFRVGLLTDFATPAFTGTVASGLARLVVAKDSAVTVEAWAASVSAQNAVPDSAAVRCASPVYADFVDELRRSPPDLMLIPVSAHADCEVRGDEILAELAAARVPVLASARAPLLSLEHGQTGLLIGDDPTAWCEFTERVLGCPSLRQQLVDRAFHTVMAERTVNQRAAMWAEILAALTREQTEPTDERTMETASATDA